MNTRGLALWGLYFAFATYALIAYWHTTILDFSGPLGVAKFLVWLALAGFVVYSIYCTTREDIFRTVATISKFHWARQIGLDLYLGIFIGALIITMHEGALVLLIWLVPLLIFANLTMLLYIAVNFDSIAGKLL